MAESSDESGDDAALDALAQAYGIEPDFLDARGNRQYAPAKAKRALLAAMGVRAAPAAEVQAARDARDEAAWDRALPPVVVAASASIELPVVLPRGTAGVTWRALLEAGGDRTGTAAFSDLPLVAERARDGHVFERRLLRLPTDLPHGYHECTIEPGGGAGRLIVTPSACWLPPSIEAGGRLSGIAIQLYLLRSAANWGIGDFTDLRNFVELVAGRGADVVGLNPLHQMFLDDPEHASPYSPASRLLLNTLNIDVTAVPEYATSEDAQQRVQQRDFQAALQACRETQLVDYTAVAALKLELLRLLFVAFTDSATSERKECFARYRAGGTRTLERTYVFAALREFLAARDKDLAAWQRWPAEYRDPASPSVAEFARDHAADVTFAAWLQWIADAQLGSAACAARHMHIGLYRDLAVGADPGGPETWCNGRAVVDAARIGAPPDILNTVGQNWDLPPFNPNALRDEGYAGYIELVRANMRHAGALRIDHAMALQHEYWIPCGAQPRDGAYVRYPLDDLVGILALESHRAQCLVVGEDLGTVPAGFRERMRDANILSYRVVFFERDDEAIFFAPAVYPRGALAVLGNHDLPTLSAWWNGGDLRLRDRLGMFADAAAGDAHLRKRSADRDAFVLALRRAGVLDAQRAVDRDVLFTAAHAFLAQTACALAIAQLDDITDEADPINVPTTGDEYPNWRRRASCTLEDLDTDPRLATLFGVFGAAGRLHI